MKKKQREVVDRLGNKIDVGDIITYIEQRKDYNQKWSKAYFGKAIVTKICDKTILLKPILLTIDDVNIMKKDELHEYRWDKDSQSADIYSSRRKLFRDTKYTFFKIGHCDGPTLLEIIQGVV